MTEGSGPADDSASTATEVVVSTWGEAGPRPEPNHDLDELFGAMRAEADVAVRCSAEDAWSLVSDVTRIGEFSPECVEAWWTEGYPARAVGGRFEGRNRVVHDQGTTEWIRACDVVDWTPPRRFAWTTGDRYDATPATRWSFEVEPTDEGVVLRQCFEHVVDGLSGIRTAAEANPEAAAQIVAMRLEGLEAGMAATLERMRAVLEAGSA